MEIPKASSVKSHSFVPYGRQVDENYIGHTADANVYKKKDQLV